jgi:peptide/nickel transport system substrate-binding protein
MAVTVVSPPPLVPGMQHVVQALNDLGYHARLSVYKGDDYFAYLADSRHRFQAAFGGWVADFPNPADFIATQYTCADFTPASPASQNVTEFCRPAIDRLIAQAERVAASSQVDANRLWAAIDRHLVDAVPWIGVVTPSWVDVVSMRVHNYVRSSVLGVFFDQMWVR